MKLELFEGWFSALHPYFVHFPLALLLTLLLVELLWRRRQDREVNNLLLFALLVTGISAALAVSSGLLLSQIAAHQPDQVAAHRDRGFVTLWLLLACILLKALGDADRRQRLVHFLHLRGPINLLAVAGSVLVRMFRNPIWRHWLMRLLLLPVLLLWWLLKMLTWPVRVLLRRPLRWARREGAWQNAYLLTLLLTVVSVNGAGQLGAALAHGGDHGIRLPWSAAEQPLASTTPGDGEYHRRVKPLLDDYCVRCHGPGTQKGNLRLDNRDSMLARRDPLPAIAPGDVMRSDVVRRLLLSRDHEHAMPPVGETQPGGDLLPVLVAWIERGALFGEPPPPPRDQPEWRLADELAPLPDNVIPGLRSEGLVVHSLAEENPLLSVSFREVPESRLEAAWASLFPQLERVAWLDLAGHRLPTDLMFRLGEMPRLTRLDLRGAEISEGDVLALSGLVELRRLNVLNTGLEQTLLANLDLPRLERLYVSGESAP